MYGAWYGIFAYMKWKMVDMFVVSKYDKPGCYGLRLADLVTHPNLINMACDF